MSEHHSSHISLPACLPTELASALWHAHSTWQPVLVAGLMAMQQAQPSYLSELVTSLYLPTNNRLFAAFSKPIDSVHYVLFGEGPYPREQSATGVCFMDGAVTALWQPNVGLTKQVNRATSLRNFIKMLLVADNVIAPNNTGASALIEVANQATRTNSAWIQTGAELQDNLMQNGFLLLNASLVFRKEVAPTKDAQAWLPFLRCVLQHLAKQNTPMTPPTLILWGKIQQLPETQAFAAVTSEHPYNLSFIQHNAMQQLFKPFNLLKKRQLKRDGD